MPKILAIDDKKNNLLSISALLKNLIPGCDVITALSGEEGIKKAKQELPDTILLDIIMPGMDGFDVCQELKSNDIIKHIPVIILTAIRTDSKSRIKALELGADAFLTKPIDPAELTAQVRAMLRIKNSEDKIRKEKESLENLVEKRTKEFQESEKKFRVLYNNSPDMFVSVSPDDARILLCNDTLLKKTGYSREEIIGSPIFKMYHDDCMEEVKNTFQQFVKTGKIQDKELILKRKDGSKIEVSLNVDAVRNDAGKILYSISSWRDITERKHVENQIKKSLKEKDILIKEIYHRVKNNLAVVSGILNLQSKYIEDKKAIDAIRETQIRVTSMAMIHSHLSDSENYTSIEYKKYVKNLVTNIFHSLKMSGQIKLHFDLDDIILPIDKAMPCGLLLNELVSNALKHAFLKNRKGNLRIIMSSLEDKNCELIVKDDGVGLPENFDLEKSKTFGLKLINIMTKQIDGTIEIISDKGTEFRIRMNTEPRQEIR